MADDFAPAWSPDGSTIAFVSNRDGSPGDIWTMPAAGGEPTRITTLGNVFAPIWCEGGESLVFSSTATEGGHARVFRVPAGGGEPTRLTGGDYDVVSDCSPDGKNIVYAGHSSGAFDLFLMPVAGGPAKQITTTDHWEFAATWSADGRHLAYLSNEGGNYDLYVLRQGEETATRVTNSPGNESGAAWSPDGTTLLYNLNIGSNDLWTMEVAAELAKGS
jgi:TolB protein